MAAFGFKVGASVGPGRTWGEVEPGDRFKLLSGETLTVKSRTKHYVSFDGDRPIDQNVNIIHAIHSGAVYLGQQAEREAK